MKNLFKKNQLMITALAIMIAIAGYLQFAGTNLEEEYLTVQDEAVGSGGVITEIASLDSDVDILVEDYLDADLTLEGADPVASDELSVAEVEPEEDEIPGEAVFTSTQALSTLSAAKLLKEQTRAKNKEALTEIVNQEGLDADQKQKAVDEVVALTDLSEKEMEAEILLSAKGFPESVVSIGSEGVDVMVVADALSDAQLAQILDIVSRKTERGADQIIISHVGN